MIIIHWEFRCDLCGKTEHVKNCEGAVLVSEVGSDLAARSWALRIDPKGETWPRPKGWQNEPLREHRPDKHWCGDCTAAVLEVVQERRASR